MRLGLHFATTNWEGGPRVIGPKLVAVVQAAEAAGFDAIDVVDHLWLYPTMGGPVGSQLEAYTMLGFVAAHTHRVRLLTLVTSVPFRHAGLIGKMVSTLDVLSGGRAMLGIGAGNWVEEARGLGLPFPPLRERFELLEETVQACLRMWQGDDRPFHGKHVHMERPLGVPLTISRPHPPILIAGEGEQRTLPLVARYADACNFRPSSDIPRKLDLLRELCQREGRDYDAIEKTAIWAIDVGSDGSKVNELRDKLRWIAGLGIQTVFGYVPGMENITPLQIIGREIIPAVADL